MKPGRYLSPDEVRIGQRVLVLPVGVIVRGVGRGAYPAAGEVRAVDDTIHGAARRGALQMFEPLPDEAPPAPEPTPSQPEEH